jgi:flagellar operon protein
MDQKITNPKIQQLVQTPVAPRPQTKAQPGSGFADILQSQLDVKVSGHAQTRLQSRNIELNREDWERVRSGIEKAAEKGSRESLVMIDDVALVVSVKNRTVITAVAREQLRDNVFTNIDSAVFV